MTYAFQDPGRSVGELLNSDVINFSPLVTSKALLVVTAAKEL